MQKFKVLSSKKQRKASKAVRLLFPRPLYERLRASFAGSEAVSRESYAVAQCGYRVESSRKKWDYLVRSIHIPSREDLYEQSSITVTPRAEFIEAILSEASEKNNAVIELHTHVGSREPNFSWIDIENGLENGRFLKSCGLRFAMSVVGTEGLSFCEYDTDHDALQMPERCCISAIGRNGPRDVVSHKSSTSCEIRSGPAIEGVRVAVAGLDGIGFGIAYMLARQGVKNFVLLDDGVVEKGDPGFMPYTPEAGKKKTKAAQHMLKRISKDIETVQVSDVARDAPGALRECDLVFSCGTDTLLRGVVEDASLKYFIPCIEARAVKRSGAGGISGLVRVLVPSVTGCGACFSDDGPLSAAGPSCAMINGVVSSMALQEFMAMFSGSDESKPYDRIEYDPVTLAIERKSTARDPACPKCGLDGMLGAGDERKPRRS